jgi:hypothetical protein
VEERERGQMVDRHEEGSLSLNCAEGTELLDQTESCHTSAAFPSTVLHQPTQIKLS